MSERENQQVGPLEESDLDYFRRLEKLFIDLRGAPLLLSPADWETARRWKSEGIPLDLVERVLREVFLRSPEKRGRSGVRGLKYFDSAVQGAWDEVLALGIEAIDRGAQPLDVPGRLAALVAALPSSPSGMDGLRPRIAALSGAAEDVEAALAALDAEMLRLVEQAMTPSVREMLDRDVDTALSKVGGRVRGDESGDLRQQLERQQIRRHWGLPVLSLFSSEAMGTNEGE
jgi:hypothetical protein